MNVPVTSAPMHQADVVVVGGGILGASFTAALAAKGRRVVLIERHSRPGDGSVRNFGLAWPFIMPSAEWIPDHLATAALYARLARSFDFDYRADGALLVAHRPDELALLERFAERCVGLELPARLLTGLEAAEQQPLLAGGTSLGALFFPAAAALNPRRFVAGWLHHLATLEGVVIRTATTAVALDSRGGRHVVATNEGGRVECNRVVICSGEDFQTLLPDVLRASGLVRCKLQMLETEPVGAGGPSLAFGRSLRHYPLLAGSGGTTAGAAEIGAVRGTEAELDRYGIHLLLKPTPEGTLVLGDSHEDQPGEAPRDFDYSTRIEKLLLQLAREALGPAGARLEPRSRWLGYYARHPGRTYFEASPAPGLHVFSGLTCGMSAGPGFAERRARDW